MVHSLSTDTFKGRIEDVKQILLDSLTFLNLWLPVLIHDLRKGKQSMKCIAWASLSLTVPPSFSFQLMQKLQLKLDKIYSNLIKDSEFSF